MKKDNLIKGAAVLGVLTLMTGGVVAANAAGNNSKSLEGKNRGQNAVTLTATQQANRTERQTEMKTRQDAIEAAIKANDYAAWVKAVGENNPITKKITKDNFAKFIEAHNLVEQARTIFTDLGLKNGEGKGAGMGIGVGIGHMMDK
jgi:hypothetical protein